MGLRLENILEKRRFRDIRLWQRSEPIPREMLAGGHETLARSFSRRERASRRVAFLLGNEPAFALALFAAMRRRDSVVLLNPTLAPAEITDILQRTTPRLVITSTPHVAKLRQVANVGRQIDQLCFPPFGDVLIFDAVANAEPAPVRDDEFACLVTSGTSGRPRIVSRTCANIDDELENYTKFVGISDRDVFFCPVPLFHAYGLFVGLLPAIATGAACVLAPNLAADDIISLTHFHRPTVLLGVPFIYELVSKSTNAGKCNFGCYRYLFSAGAPLTERLASNVLLKLRAALNPLYGTTETGVVAVGLERQAFVLGFVGTPITGTNIRIFGEQGMEAADGAGDIGILSRATGSYLDQQESAARWKDNWFFPGDTGLLDRDGNLYVTGRKFPLINVASLKVDPAEVESALVGSGLTVDCAVVGVPRLDFGEFIRAYVVPGPGATIKELRAACRRQLAPFKVPREFVIVEHLPRSATGKVLRKYLTDPTCGS